MNDTEKKKTIIHRIQNKIKSAHLRPEETEAIDKARRQVFNRTTFGSLVGTLGTHYLLRRKRLSPLFTIPLIGGGFLVGSQMGMASGIMAGMNTINKLPDQTRLHNLVKDIQQEVMQANGYTRDPDAPLMSRPRPMTLEEKQKYEQSLLKQEQSTQFNDYNDSSDSNNNNKNDGGYYSVQQPREEETLDDPWWSEKKE